MNKSVQDLYNEFIERIEGKFSRRNYEHRLRYFLRDYGELDLASITPKKINEWRDGMDSLGHAQATNAGYRQAIRSLWKFAVDQRYISISPADHIRVGSFHSERSMLPPENDVQRMLHKALEWTKSDNMRKRRIAAQFILSYESGGRLRSLCEVKLDEVIRGINADPIISQMSPDEPPIAVFRVLAPGKSDRIKPTYLWFSETFVDAVNAWLEVRPRCAVSELFCTTRKTSTSFDPEKRYRPLQRSAFDKDLISLSKAAGVATVRTHRARHRKGTEIVKKRNAGLAANVLGHSSEDITIKMYYHPSLLDVAEAVASVSPSAQLGSVLAEGFFYKVG